MSYICYVDLSGEVLGFLSEPVPADYEDSTEEYAGRRCA